jgi:hypothetical protein
MCFLRRVNETETSNGFLGETATLPLWLVTHDKKKPECINL